MRVSSKQAKVVVLGGGYAGVAAATRLARANTAVTLVNPRNEFVERIRLHQYVAGNHAAVSPMRNHLPETVEFRHDTAGVIDAQARRVELLDSGSLEYDYLVYAVGSRAGRTGIAGAAESAVSVSTWEDAVAARRRLDALPDGATVTVVGGGLTGIETAAELNELDRFAVRLISAGALGATLNTHAQNRLRQYFREAGVLVIENTRVVEIFDNKLVLDDGRHLGSELTLVTTAFQAPELAAGSGLATTATGALEVSETLVSTSASTIVGAGDGCAFAARPLRMSAQAANPTGVHAADTVLALLDGREPKPVRRKYVGQAMSLGRRNALIQTSDLADRPRRPVLTGRVAATVKEQICSATLGFGHFGPLRYNWSWPIGR
ncbi:FAD-dependent oxidoreductase [Nocardia vulneris]|uniref:NAD(P)/FAD-dependent oxidoreductase n=1 Tax=Nocardia vulneris TaxID=1141657 RepID=UPI0030D38C60